VLKGGTRARTLTATINEAPLTCAIGNGTFSGSIRQLLRTKTKADHAHVDSRFSALINRGPAAYGEFLRLSAAAIYPIEHALVVGEIERVLPDWHRRVRKAALSADLEELRIEAPALSPLPQLRGEPQLFGALYVLEGSRLGARVLIQRLQAAPNPPPRSTMRYLRHGEGQSLWRTFLEKLESSAAVRRSPADVILGARLAFACFGGDVTAGATAEMPA
jgi:heme oxygenase